MQLCRRVDSAQLGTLSLSSLSPATRSDRRCRTCRQYGTMKAKKGIAKTYAQLGKSYTALIATH